MMHPQLETLLEIQDLKSQKNDLLDQSEGQNVEREFFHISIEDAVTQVERKIGEMEESLVPAVRSRYRRLSGRGKFIVPVINGTCFGCFVSIPTAVVSVSDRNNSLQHCDNCGRFLYIVD
ncbi:MAG: C4-type zinc ribbon domain-containing protein [Gemmatimonadota bacterium]|jgi:predicted  nucleic acid-binding Zn-ribbon protein|nr:C4-type zinc ribbon domain-containing protein [Gemmatimonadota bacterium]